MPGPASGCARTSCARSRRAGERCCPLDARWRRALRAGSRCGDGRPDLRRRPPVRDLPALPCVGLGLDLLARAEQIARRQAELADQPVQRRLVGLERAFGEDVAHGQTAGDQVASHQDRAVALERLLLGTEEHEPSGPGFLLDPVQAPLERLGLRQQIVLDLVADVARGVRGAGAELAAKEEVVEAAAPQRLLERLAAELGVAATVGLRADVGHGRDAVAREEAEELPDGVGRETV